MNFLRDGTGYPIDLDANFSGPYTWCHYYSIHKVMATWVLLHRPTTGHVGVDQCLRILERLQKRTSRFAMWHLNWENEGEEIVKVCLNSPTIYKHFLQVLARVLSLKPKNHEDWVHTEDYEAHVGIKEVYIAAFLEVAVFANLIENGASRWWCTPEGIEFVKKYSCSKKSKSATKT